MNGIDMNHSQPLATTLALSLLAGSVLLVQESAAQHEHQPLPWMEYESMDLDNRIELIRSLKHAIHTCGKSNCADQHYQLAIVYMSGQAPSRKALDSADLHLRKAAQDERYLEQTLVLRKLLHAWIHSVDQIARLEKQLQRLEKSLERAKIIDLETIED